MRSRWLRQGIRSKHLRDQLQLIHQYFSRERTSKSRDDSGNSEEKHNRPDWYELLVLLIENPPGKGLSIADISSHLFGSAEANEAVKQVAGTAFERLVEFYREPTRARRIHIGIRHLHAYYYISCYRMERRYTFWDRKRVLDELPRIRTLIPNKSEGEKAEPQWYRLMTVLVSAELRGVCPSNELLAATVCGQKSTSQVAAVRGKLKNKLSAARYLPGCQVYFDVGSDGLFNFIEARSIPPGLRLSNFLQRNLPLTLGKYLVAREHSPAPGPGPGWLFVLAALSQAMWMMICRFMGWAYYLGGKGNEVSGWHGVIWGMATALPVVGCFTVALLRAEGIRLRWADLLRCSIVAPLQIITAGFGSWVLYDSPIRPLFERVFSGRVLQEFVIALIWSFLFAAPVVAVANGLLRLGWKSLGQTFVRVALTVASIAAAFQWLVPGPHTEACLPWLKAYGSDVFIEMPQGCSAGPARIVFDQVRGLLAGVALPLTTMSLLLDFVQAYSSRRIRPSFPNQ